MAKSKLVKANEKIAEKVVGGYQKIEEGAVGGFNKIADKFVDNYLTKEGETVEEARERLAGEEKKRKEASQAESEKRSAQQQGMIGVNRQNAQNATLEARRKAASQTWGLFNYT